MSANAAVAKNPWVDPKAPLFLLLGEPVAVATTDADETTAVAVSKVPTIWELQFNWKLPPVGADETKQEFWGIGKAGTVKGTLQAESL